MNFWKKYRISGFDHEKMRFLLKNSKICKKILKNPKYVNLPKNGKICKKIFFTYLHKNPGPSNNLSSIGLLEL